MNATVTTTEISQTPGAVISRGPVFTARRPGNATGVKLDGLLVGQDSQMLGALSRALGQFDVEATIAGSRDKAEESILNSKFDAIIIDLRNRELGGEVLRSVRNTRLNRRTMVIAIADDYERHQQAFQAGANFTIPRVSSLDQATRCLRSSYFMMLRQRRSSMRFPLDMPVTLRCGERTMDVRLLNLSETGIGMQTACELNASDLFVANFDLPGTGKPVKLCARTVWVNASGVAGAAFTQLDEGTVQNLQDWINGNLMGRFEFAGVK